MASDLIVGPKSIPASTDLSTKQFYFVAIDSSGQLEVQSSTGGLAIGVLQDKPTAQYQPGMVCRPGDITKVVAGGEITAGDLISSTNAGKAVLTVSGYWILGQALDDGSANELIRVVFQPMGRL